MSFLISFPIVAQEVIPFDTTHWDINAQSYILENYNGKDAIYLQRGRAVLKDTKFFNGTIEFDIYLTERQGFPGVLFRIFDRGNAESFYLRPHLPNKPDGTQAVPVINGLSAWQLYFGPTYSFPYDYKYDDWTHVKLVVNGSRAQVYLDGAAQPHFSWNLTHPPREGDIAIGGGGAPMHYANFKINKNAKEMIDFKVIERAPIKDLVPSWEVSDKFEEKLLADPLKLKTTIQSRSWLKRVNVEEGTAANLARAANLRDGNPGNTVFAKITIQSDIDQIKLFDFGYSDRVVVILNGKAIYKGDNGYRSRDYR